MPRGVSDTQQLRVLTAPRLFLLPNKIGRYSWEIRRTKWLSVGVGELFSSLRYAATLALFMSTLNWVLDPYYVVARMLPCQ